MRVFVGLSLLAMLFWMASTWQSRQTERIRRERDQKHGTLQAQTSTPGDGQPQPQSSASWSTLILGRPSGVEPIARRAAPPEPGRRGASARTDPRQPGTGAQALPIEASAPHGGSAPNSGEGAPPAQVDYRVRRGDSLSMICADFYGTERGSFANLSQLARAVALYNGMKNADELQQGQVLKLPALARLGEQ